MKVTNMTSAAGNKVANQFIIETEEGAYFQSYDTIIAFRPLAGKIQLDAKMWECSVTTGKYRNDFLGEDITETRRKIMGEVYELVDLNGEGGCVFPVLRYDYRVSPIGGDCDV